MPSALTDQFWDINLDEHRLSAVSVRQGLTKKLEVADDESGLSVVVIPVGYH